MASGRKKICKAISFVFAAVFVFTALFAYLFYLDLKKIFIAEISWKASSIAGQQIDIGDISFSLATGINIRDIEMRNPEGFLPGNLLKIKKIVFNMDYRRLFEGEFHFTRIAVYGPELTVMKDRKGRLNISDDLKQFLSKKSALTYQVDEFRILYGMADFNQDVRLRNDRINLTMKNISSAPGTKTLIDGDTLWSGENNMKFNGWMGLKDTLKKFNISVSSENFSLSPLRMILAKYRIDAENTRIKMRLDAEGDTVNGVRLTSRAEIKSPGYNIYKKDLLNINMDLSAFYDIPADAATINNLSVRAGKASALILSGRLMELRKNPSYDLAARLESLDLSAFNIARGFRVSGILTSDVIKIKGRLDQPLPGVSGSVQLKQASVKSDTAYARNINARMTFSAGREISAGAKVSAEILNAGGYSLGRPVDMELSMNAKKQRKALALSASLTASPISPGTGKEIGLSLDGIHILMDGVLKDKVFSGKSAVNAKSIRYGNYSFNKLKSGFEFNYEQDGIAIINTGIETEEFASSADLVTMKTNASKKIFLIKAKNLSAAYPAKKAGLKGLDFSATLNTGGKNSSGDAAFSVSEVRLQEIKSGNLTGSGKFNEREFSLDIPKAEVAGGRIRLSAQGKTSGGPFPVKAEIAAAQVDLGEIMSAMEKHLQTGHRISGKMKSSAFKGTIDSKESVHGVMVFDLQKFSVVRKKTGRYLLKDVLLQSNIELQGRDCEFMASASAGNVMTKASGKAKGFLGKNRSVHMQGHLKEIPATEVRNAFWDVFPDSFLYAGMGGFVSSDIRIDYRQNKFAFAGDLKLKDFSLEGENGEYSVGPVNGTVPFAYGGVEAREKITLPSFERSKFESISRRYAEAYSGDGYNKITVGSLQYGFRLLTDLEVRIKQDGGIWNIGRFSANIFGGRLNGSAVIDFSNGLNYMAGVVIEKLSLTSLCDDIGPIKGYISGKVDGIAALKGSGADMSQLIGKADIWTYRTKDEKTKISREFLQKIGGPSIKSYLGDRNFDKGVMGLYIQKGFLIFRELEISNRNFLGIQDLSVKVAPFNNRISIDHLIWTIVEAGQRAKKNNK